MSQDRQAPLRSVELHGVPCSECGLPAHSMTIFDDHTTTTHEAPVSYCVTIAAPVEDRRRADEGISPTGY